MVPAGLLDYALSGAIDWSLDFVWVQETSLLEVVTDDRGSEVILVRRPDGTEAPLSRSAARRRYFAIDGGRYLKPNYAPRMAHVLHTPLSLEKNGRTIRLQAGDAFTLGQDGSVALLSEADLARDYAAVSRPSDTRYPDLPFPADDMSGEEIE